MKKLKIFSVLIIIIFMLATALLTVSCIAINNDESLEEMEVVDIPSVVYAGKFDDAGIKIKLTVGNDVQYIPVTESMIPDNYKEYYL